ncbi:MAG TPA: helix-turn-helix transcriptional regulator [Rhodocyclaceae bacterium]|nr:helix-turn-helix transcriptional regulator [Rhodocyclaceae bacterium]
MPRKKKNQNGLGARIGQNIKSARTRMGLTQAKLAEAIGVEVETISRIETGVQLPSLERLEDMAAALNQPLAILVAEEDLRGHPMLAVLAELPEREQDFVRAFIADYVQHWKAGAKERKR